jgi:threonine/homoserine/homoserine lactone efflux protein
MTPDQIVAFISFSIVLAITPGPSNTLLTSTGGSVGVLRGLPAVIGVAVGMAILMFVAASSVGTLILAQPAILTAVKWVGAAVICWLAWKIASSRSSGPEAAGRPIGFLGAVSFQWINPKSWLAVTSGAATFVDPSRGSAYPQALLLALIFAAVVLPCSAAWLAFGAAIQRVLHSERARRVFNVTMGLLLAASAVVIVL